MGGRAVAWEELLPSLGRIAVAREALASLGGRVLAWEGMLPSVGMIAVTEEVLATLGGRVLAWEGMLPSPAGGGICLGSGLINLTTCLYN